MFTAHPIARIIASLSTLNRNDAQGRRVVVFAVGARPILAPGWSGKPHTDIALVDCDVHQTVKKMDDLIPYMTRVYAQQAREQGFRMPGSGYFNVSGSIARQDLQPVDCDGGFDGQTEVGHSYEQLRDTHLDLWNIDKVLLTGASTYLASLLPDPDFGAAMCSAFNDWTVENWLDKDDRLFAAMSINVSDPKLAVAEIERLAHDKRFRAVMLATGSRMPYGNRFFHPIWEACEKHGLVVTIHIGNEGAGMAGPPTGVGYPTYYIETRMARPQMAMAHAVSFIAEGVFEKYPGLKVLFDEADQFWAVGLMWHMDADWKGLRDQTPWVKRLPSEYFREHIRVGSQPLLQPETNDQFWMMLDAMHADETLVYCSDWPHWDWDDPASSFPKLPERLHRRVFAENARELFAL
jgi:predicted TIM-barrel fold metal-dependent hydrolase